jgi:hypothetical protein
MYLLPVALESTLDLKSWLYLVLSHYQVDENKRTNCYSKDELTRYEILWLYCTVLRETSGSPGKWFKKTSVSHPVNNLRAGAFFFGVTLRNFFDSLRNFSL